MTFLKNIEGIIVFGDDEGGISAIDTATRKRRWRVVAVDRRTSPTAVVVPVGSPHQRVPLGRDLITVVEEDR